MSKSKLKVNFFEDEIQYLALFRDCIQGIKTLIRQIITFSDPQSQWKYIKKINCELIQQIYQIKTNINQIRKLTSTTYDQNKLQQSIVFGSHQQKIQQLNNYLIFAQNYVQQIQTLKKQLFYDQSQDLSNTLSKSLKKTQDYFILDTFVKKRILVVQEFMRSMELLTNIKEQNSKPYLHSKQHQLLNMRSSKLPYRCMRAMQKFDESKKSKSQEKYRISQISAPVSQKFNPQMPQKQPLILLLLRSQLPDYNTYRAIAQKQLIHKIRQKNQQYTATSKHLSSGLQQKRKDKVLTYLQTKQQLNEQQSIMKVQLMSNKLNAHIDQRLLSFKYNKPSHQFNEGVTTTNKNLSLTNPRQAKSQNKNKYPNLKSNKSHSNYLQKQILIKQGQSNPKTNDSLTQAIC